MTIELTDSELVQKVEAGDFGSAEALVSRHEVKVYSMAMHLTSDEREAANVTEQVFVQLINNVIDGAKEEFESMLHRVTYEFAIASLLGRVEQHSQDVKALCENITGLEMADNHYEPTDRPLQEARWRLIDAGDTLDTADDALEIIESD